MTEFIFFSFEMKHQKVAIEAHGDTPHSVIPLYGVIDILTLLGFRLMSQ